ncbi:MAG: DUF3459 domain-containing protein [Clostridium sp.]|nr:DUF3459 domain-containing protein [Clostridium sp.]
MIDQKIFDSKDLRCKAPYGAVPVDTRVQLTLRPHRADGVSRCTVSLTYEGEGERTEEQPMDWADLEDGRDVYTVRIHAGANPGLLWYSFRLERLEGEPLCLGPYQLTVYDDSEQVPTWFGEGMSYQIFPDRFHRTRIPDPTGMVGGRQVHQDWEEEPEYRPNAQGEVRNRDFFGGDLAGITEKLDYLKDLGVETLYFCPIFEAAENHRYGTADYSRIDPMLGCEEDFTRLCEQAHSRGMRVMLDGVFNHTGFVSRYFNGDGFYPEPGASQSQDAPCYSWFNFRHWPDDYESWWGIYSLPAVNEHDPSYRDFIFGGKDSVVRRWLRAGADGWRLDVADELPDDFVQGVHAAARAEKPHAVVIGEVWEDGSTKIAYGVRRKHVLGGHCDGLMNYPFREAALAYLLGGDGENFVNAMETIRENYPPFAFYSAMNALGTHDTLRVLTLLGVGGTCAEQSKDWRAEYRMSAQQRRRGTELLKAGAALLFCFPGSPTVYYGDEAGMEGFEDPFNRRTYPWGKEDRELLEWFSGLGALRRTHPALRRGDLKYMAGKGNVLAFTRSGEGETLLCACNVGEETVRLPLEGDALPRTLLGEGRGELGEEGLCLNLPPRTGTVFQLS